MFNVQDLRNMFPALAPVRGGLTGGRVEQESTSEQGSKTLVDPSRQHDGSPRSDGNQAPVFLDGPGGTQVPQQVIDALTHYLIHANANVGGAFQTSVRSDEIIRGAHQAVADLLNAPSPDEIIFGPNMTALTFHLSRSFAQRLQPGDEVLVTRMDHDANIRPWMLAARDAGARATFVDLRPEDCTLDMEDLKAKLHPRVKLLAVTCASNVVGTINDVRQLCALAHEVGAWVYLDAVHYAAHGPVDVEAWDCDFLACSAYKFFGPHVGILWGRRALLEELPAYKVRPAPDSLPGRWMTGTQNHEGLAGVTAAIDYLAAIADVEPAPESIPRRQQLLASMTTIQAHEITLARRLLAGLAARPHFRVWGITAEDNLAWRVPTVAITSSRHSSTHIARHLAEREIYAWAGHMYAIELAERLGVLSSPADDSAEKSKDGFVRLGLVHYNTHEEVERLLAALDEL